MQTIENHFTDHPSVFLEQLMDIDSWIAAGRPHVWSKVEESRGYTVWLDTGYGMLALTRGGHLIGAGRTHVIGKAGHKHVAVLDREYYGVPTYLFFAER